MSTSRRDFIASASILAAGKAIIGARPDDERREPTAGSRPEEGPISLVLDSEALQVEFGSGTPFPRSYLHKASGLRFAGVPAGACPTVGGEPVEWEVAVSQAGGVAYDLRAGDRALRLGYELSGFELSLELTVLTGAVTTVEAPFPLVTCQIPEQTVWREEWTQRGWQEEIGRGLWSPSLRERSLAELTPDAEPRPCIYCCTYSPEQVCVALSSSARYMPLRNQVTSDGFAIGLGPYQYRVRKRYMEPLRVRLAFLPDINGDGRIDSSDFQLWANRQLAQPWPTHRDAIWYKIYCGDVVSGVTTTFAQAREVIEFVHRHTDGLRQIPYLVGWQYGGHDTGYPSIDQVNTGLGTADELRALHKDAKERLNTTLSYHINLDDSYPNHPGWDESVICREPDGDLMRWEPFSDGMSYHVSHVKDVESGKVFRRLEAMMHTVPVEGALHIDAFRDMNWSWEPDGLIGPVEEMECGLKPIVEFLRARGIDVTIESMDSQGAEMCGIVSGILHFGAPRDLVQLRHGKMLHGGRSWPQTLWDWGLGCSIKWDVSHPGNEHKAYSPEAWHALLDGIYLGTLLYHFYLERELTVCHVDPEAARMRFSDGTTALVARDSSRLLVTNGEVVVAEDYDRFIPRGDSVYAYSREGSMRTWKLPPGLRGRRVEVRELGDSAGDVRTVQVDEEIELTLRPRVPVRILLAV